MATETSVQMIPVLRCDLNWLRTRHAYLAAKWEAGSLAEFWPLKNTAGHERALADLLVTSGEVSRAAPELVSIVVPFFGDGDAARGDDVDAGGARAWDQVAEWVSRGEACRVTNRLDPQAAFEIRPEGEQVSITGTRGRARGRSIRITREAFAAAVKQALCAMDDFEHRLRVVLQLKLGQSAADRYLYALLGLGRMSAVTPL